MKDELGHATTDGAGDALSWVERLDLVTHRIGDGHSSAARRINFNGANSQKAIFVQAGSGDAGEPWGENHGAPPSANEFTRVLLSKLKGTVTLERAITQAQTTIFYTGASDPSFDRVWHDNGRVRIGDEVIGYAKAWPAQSPSTNVKTAKVQVPADSTTIITSTFPLEGEFRHVRIGDEVINVAPENTVYPIHGKLAEVQAVAQGADTVNLVPEVLSMPTIAPGAYAYLKIGTGVTAEWIKYTGHEIVGDHFRLTGVSRGQLGTLDRAHAANAAMDLPFQYMKVERGKFETAAAAIPIDLTVVPVGVFEGCDRGATPSAHAAGSAVSIFTNVDDAVRLVVAHEVGHAVGLSHRDGSIMMGEEALTTLHRGAYLNNGMFEQFDDEQMDQFLDAR